MADNSTSTFLFPNSIRDYRSGSVANNGYFAFRGGTQGLALAPLGTAMTSLAGIATSARVDADGTVSIWAQPVHGTTVIMAANTHTQETRTLFSCSDDSYNPSISSDSMRALFLKADSLRVPQAFLIGTNGSGLTQVTRELAGLTDAMLSPDGQTVIAISGEKLSANLKDLQFLLVCTVTSEVS